MSRVSYRGSYFVGQVAFAAKWRDGYGEMTAVDAAKVRK